MRRGSNLRALGGFNQTVVLDVIRRSASGVSRVEIAEQTGLSTQTVSNVARRLLDAGMIREAGIQIRGVGKPRTVLQLDPSGHFAIGVHIDPAVITYVLLDIHGTTIGHTASRPPFGADPAAVIAGMSDTIEALLASTGVDRARVLGVGIASPGPIDAKRGVVLDPPLLTTWHGVALRDELERVTGFFVVLEKDVSAAAVAEVWTSSGHERDDFLFLYYGSGVGVGLVLGREVARGPTSNAGDVGHVMVDPDGPVCRCGRRGCLGDAVSPETLVTTAVAGGVIDASPQPLTTDDIDRGFSRIAELADAGEPQAMRILDEAVRDLATAIVTIVTLLDLHVVVFGGPYWERISSFASSRLPELINDSPALVLTAPVVVTSSAIGEDVAAVGAACLILDFALSPRSSALFISK
ncbi:ROK family transcriptional regulator [Planctomonas psychrotolerans]|uniref:ROK family transcriptional regulator n=1 Tax=Planctomonas psychrotolerans TaxID=2528712 RepID=UPI0012397D0D